MATPTVRVQTYRLPRESFSPLRRHDYRLQATVLTVVVVLFVVFAVRESGTGELSWVTLVPIAILIPAVVLAAAYWTSRGSKQREETWLSYELVVGGDFLIRRLQGSPEAQINRDEVVAVHESSEGLVVQTASKERFIAIPAASEGFAEVRAHIANWAAPSAAPRYRTPLLYAIASGLPLAALVLIAAVTLVQRSWLVISTGISLLVIFTWGIVAALRNPTLSRREKWKFALLILPLIGIVYRVIEAATNWR